MRRSTVSTGSPWSARARAVGGAKDVPTLDAQELLSVLTHELRSPLATLATTLDVLAESFEEVDKEDARGLLLRMQRSASWMQCLLDNLSVVARLDAHRLRLFPSVVDLTTCLETALAVVQPSLDQRKQAVQFVGLPWEAVWGDERSIIQILVNLLSNASKYGDPDSEIQLIAERVRRTVKVTIRNAGLPLQSAEQERLFGRYERGKAAILSGSPGLGLGLYIVKMLVEMQDGEVGVSSAPGEGVSFWFTLRSHSV